MMGQIMANDQKIVNLVKSGFIIALEKVEEADDFTTDNLIRGLTSKAKLKSLLKSSAITGQSLAKFYCENNESEFQLCIREKLRISREIHLIIEYIVDLCEIFPH